MKTKLNWDNEVIIMSIMSVVRSAVSILDRFVDIFIPPATKRSGWVDDPVVGAGSVRDKYYPAYSSRPDPNVKEITLLIEKYPNGIYMTNVRKAARDAGFDNFIMFDEEHKKSIWETELPYSKNMHVDRYVTDSNNIVSDENVGVEV
jgi:hypothetical protein